MFSGIAGTSSAMATVRAQKQLYLAQMYHQRRLAWLNFVKNAPRVDVETCIPKSGKRK